HRTPTSPPFPYTTLFRSDDGPAPFAALPERSAGGGQPAPHEHRARLLRRQRARRSFLRDAVYRRPRPGERDRPTAPPRRRQESRSEEHTSELQSPCNLVC